MEYDICVLGNCGIDEIYFQKENGEYDIFPQSICYGGKGSNQAIAASRAGAKVTILTKIYDDEIGKRIVTNLADNGVSIDNIEFNSKNKNGITKMYISQEDKKIEKFEKINDTINTYNLNFINNHKDVLLNSKIVMAQTNLPKRVLVELIEFCYKNNILIFITPSKPERLNIKLQTTGELLDKISIITANKEECQKMFNTVDIRRCVSALPNKLIVTLDKEGVMYSNGKQIIKLPAIEVDKIVETTGAGDTFAGNFATNYLLGYAMEPNIDRAQFASAYKLQFRTTQAGMPYIEELNYYIKEYSKNVK